MAVSGHLLILLIPVLSLCGATEYYVRPTEPINTSCPAQPCLTLNQYINESDHFFKPNTSFRFLPGTHHMDTPLVIGNVHNMSLENYGNEQPHLVTQFSCETEVIRNVHNMSLENYGNERPHLVTQFSCETEKDDFMHAESGISGQCCAAVSLHDTYNVTFRGISVTVQSSEVSAIILKNVSNGIIELVTAFSPLVHICHGILLQNTNFIEVHSFSARNFSHGLMLHNTTDTHIIDSYAAYNKINGLVINKAVDTYISNTTAAHNHLCGMFLRDMINTHISNTTTAFNVRAGMDLQTMTNTHITNTIATHNHWCGMSLAYMHSTHITNTMATRNGGSGVSLSHTFTSYLTSTIAKHNKNFGINGYYMFDTYIANTTSINNKYAGLYFFSVFNTRIVNITLTHNQATGLDLKSTNNTTISNSITSHNGRVGVYLRTMNFTHITNLTTMHNSKKSRRVLVNGQSEIAIYYCTHTHISNSSFSDIRLTSIANTATPNSMPAVIELYLSNLLLSECQFIRNSVSAVRAFASTITMSGDLVFSGNRAIAGTAFVLLHNSILIFVENSHTYFANNHAINIGGVFYIDSSPYIGGFTYTNSFCFLRTEGKRSQIRLTFVNNSAGKGGDILYGGQVALGIDGDLNCLDSFRNISNISQNGSSLISSDQSRVCVCKQNGQPDCLLLADPTLHIIYPGQTFSICAVVVGQDFGTVAGSAYAQFLHRPSNGCPPQLESWQKVQSVSKHDCSHLYCNNLQYTIFSQDEGYEAVLVLSAEDIYVSDIVTKEDFDRQNKYTSHQGNIYYTFARSRFLFMYSPFYVNISVLPCPPGFTLTNDPPFKCDCNLLLQQMHGIQCHIQDQTVGRHGLLWVGMIHNDNGTNGTLAASEYCSLDYCDMGESNVTLSEPDSQCNYNHSGTLCGRCQPGLSLALGSAKCLPCSNKYLALLIPFALAGPVLIFFIKLLDLTISEGAINGLIFYANIVKANEYILLPRGQTNPLTIFIAWLNLDFGVETCFFEGLSSYSKTWLQFVFPVYVWSIAGFIIILAKYSDRVARMMGNNSVPVLATLFLLSYAKLLRTIITALSYTTLYSSQGQKTVWTADGNVDYLGPKHAPLFAAAVAALVILWLPYMLILFLGQWLHRCNSQWISHMLTKIKPFLDAHYGPLKGKHRYWFGTLLLVRAIILLISALVPANRAHLIVLCVLVCAVALTYIGQMVYCNPVVSAFDTASFMNLALLAGFTNTAVGEPTVAAYTLIGVVFVQFVGLVLFKIFSNIKNVMKICQKEKSSEDDWELYEQSILQREEESETEEQESDYSENIESLPTY